MRINYERINLFAGIANLSSNIKIFDLSRDDIEHLCRFFGLGDLCYYEKEKGVSVSHYNAVVFMATTKGQYILKFYPPNSAKSIVTEYILNHLLLHHHFLTPTMYADLRGQPFCPSNNRLVTCYSYIDGEQAWQTITKPNTFTQINTTLLSLKNILSTTRVQLPFPKQRSLPAAISSLTQDSKNIIPSDHQKVILASLLEAGRTFRKYKRLFTRQVLHCNTHLDSFLISKGGIYTLDLSHVQEDYILTDLRNMIISCLLVNMPTPTVRNIIQDYLTRHGIASQHSLVLDTLVKMSLVKNYLMNARYERSLELYINPKEDARPHRSFLLKRKKFIIVLLKKVNRFPILRV